MGNSNIELYIEECVDGVDLKKLGENRIIAPNNDVFNAETNSHTADKQTHTHSKRHITEFYLLS